MVNHLPALARLLKIPMENLLVFSMQEGSSSSCPY